FQAVTGATTAGDIDITIDFPGDTSRYTSVEVRRVAGATAPAATCDGVGDDVTPIAAFTDTVYTDSFAEDGLVGGQRYSYRLCIRGNDDSLISFSTAENVMAKLPAN